MKILKVKQKSNQKLNEFISEIRVEAYKIFGRENKEDREQCMMMTFINGLISKKAKLVLEELKPKTPDAEKSGIICRNEFIPFVGKMSPSSMSQEN